MTLQTARKTLQALGMTLRKTDGEYRVAVRADGRESERCAYYTNDLDDAVATGRAMSRERQDIADAVASGRAKRALAREA